MTDHVYLVIAARKAGGNDYAVFSTIEGARDWCDSLDDNAYVAAVTAPFVVDVPEFGNVTEGERQ